MTSAVKAEEYFYATTLDKEGDESVWTPVQWEPAQRLAIRQLMLGHTAKADEYNVIEVEAPSVNGSVKIPIAVLKIGEQRVVQSNLEFPEGPVTFKLVEGSGPVIITGLQAPPDTSADEAYAMDEMAGEEELVDEEELLDEEDYIEEEQEPENPPKRQKLSNNK
ncbi:nucleoplasmin-like protein [Sitodiplosis mosellana]|uniref:nucleoplasmin-like protein n=1 Tax=Sitodiplosis mosellana TaxID=263140 RepID=UPI002444BE42|nr:nucleoplasmin-like protein [Sitodiplosis mosellana]